MFRDTAFTLLIYLMILHTLYEIEVIKNKSKWCKLWQTKPTITDETIIFKKIIQYCSQIYPTLFACDLAYMFL